MKFKKENDVSICYKWFNLLNSSNLNAGSCLTYAQIMKKNHVRFFFTIPRVIKFQDGAMAVNIFFFQIKMTIFRSYYTFDYSLDANKLNSSRCVSWLLVSFFLFFNSSKKFFFALGKIKLNEYYFNMIIKMF